MSLVRVATMFRTLPSKFEHPSPLIVERPSPAIYGDWHATVLHLLGLDHEQLTHRHAGRDFRLTDFHGNVVHDIVS